jgi:hypothetical protein
VAESAGRKVGGEKWVSFSVFLSRCPFLSRVSFSVSFLSVLFCLKTLCQQAARQRPFGRDPDVFRTRDANRGERPVPLFLVRKAFAFFEQMECLLRQLVPGHVLQRPGVEHVIGAPGAQQFQKVDPALTLRALEPGEQLIADEGAVAVLAVVPRPGVVHLNMIRHLQSRLQQPILLGVEVLVLLREQMVQLTRRYLDAQVVQVLQQQGLGHALVVV